MACVQLEMILYNDGELELNISVDEDTLWLTQAQLSDIFGKDQSVISRHINNIFKDNEVDKKSNMQKMHIANSDISKQLNLDFQKYNAQSKNTQLHELKKAHDRFLILDNTQMYHIGASLKDLGKKWFAFSKFEIEVLEILEKLK